METVATQGRRCAGVKGDIASESYAIGHERSAAAVVADVQPIPAEGVAAGNGEGSTAADEKAITATTHSVQRVGTDAGDDREDDGRDDGAALNVHGSVSRKNIAGKGIGQLGSYVGAAVEMVPAKSGRRARIQIHFIVEGHAIGRQSSATVVVVNS